MRTRTRSVLVLAGTTTAALVLGLPAVAGARPLAGVRVSAPKAPKSLTAGAQVTTTVTVTNARAKRSARGTLRLYLSTDGKAARDTRLAQRDVAALPAHGHAKIALTGRVPATLKAGRYRLLVSLDAHGTTTKPSHAGKGAPAVTVKPAAAPTPKPPAVRPVTVLPPAPPASAVALGSLANDIAPFVQADTPPVALAVAATTAEDTPASIVPSATDADGDALTYAVAAQPQHGLATADGATFTYTPDADYHGTDTFTYTADDGTVDSAPAAVTIAVTAVNDAPVAVDDVATLAEDGSATFSWAMVLANDTDADGDPLTGTVATQPAHGTLTETGTTLTYTPDADYHGTDSFTYTSNDGTTDSDPATVSLVVTSVNDAPVAHDDTFTTAEDTPLTVAAPGVLSDNTDADGDPLTASRVTPPTHGTLSLHADGSLTYTPDADYHGTDTFTYTSNDGTADSAPATVSLVVTSVNDAPVAHDDTFTTAEDTPLTVAAPGVLTDNTDADGDPLTGTVATQPAHGTLTLHADGSLTYAPEPDYHGTDSFTYTSNDGTTDSDPATVSLVVTSVNDAPVAHDDDYDVVAGVEDDVAAADGPLANDTDADGDPLTLDALDDVAHGMLAVNPDGSFAYTADAGYSGTDSFTYAAHDGEADSSPVTVTFHVDRAPTAAPDDYTTRERRALTIAAPAGLLANDTDPDGDPLTLGAQGLTGFAHGTATSNPDGSFTYTPQTGFTGDDTGSYAATDGVGSTAGTVTIHVTPDVAPLAQNDSYNFGRNTVGGPIAADGVLANDSDADGDHLTVTLLQTGTLGTMSLNADGSFFYQAHGTAGTDTITYQISDGLQTATATITINVI